ncbi:unnamed protein product [Angiostrongylus costaricensis]|uniref:PH domain-containing protein n=1 Tax=Angiostrongylus costaricensis TaxID=334426 RepID=A0A0R3PP97_ANGCS|nr:unnamed protein product [Angiostrongylus costaricensis]
MLRRKSWNNAGVVVVAGVPAVAIVATTLDSAGFVVAVAAFVALTAIVVVVADIAHRSQYLAFRSWWEGRN